MTKLNILWIAGAFVLGCATASVIVSEAVAAAPGSQQCVVLAIPLVNEKSIADGKHEQHGTWLPPGWVAVGGVPASAGGSPGVVACRTLE